MVKKILYAGIKYSYAKPSLGFSYEYYNFLDSIRQIKNLHVKEFDWVTLTQRLGKGRMNELLLKTVKTYKPDLVFFTLFRDEFIKKVLNEISATTLTYNWFSDDIWRFDSYARHWAKCFHWVSTQNPQLVPRYHAIGYKNVFLAHFAGNPRLYKRLRIPKKWQVSFVGQAHSNRRRMIAELARNEIEIQTWGKGWKNGPVSFKDMIKVFNQSKINLNFTYTSFSFPLGRLLPWYLQPKIIIRGKTTKCITGRMFEITCCGGFLLTDNAENLGDYFKDKKEIVVFDNLEELVEKVKYYLRHSKEREVIARAGYKRAVREHTYERRFTEIFKKIGLL